MKLLNIYLRFSLFVILILFSTLFSLSAQYESVNLENQAQGYCKRGWNLLKEGRMDEAILNYNKAIELDPGFAQAYTDLGIIFEVKGEMKKAEEMYLKAIEAAPDYLNSYSNLALLYEKQADFAKAIFYWKKRLDLSESTDPYTEVAGKRLDELKRLHPQESAPLKIEDEKSVKEIEELKQENSELIAQLNKQKELNDQLKEKARDLKNLSRRTPVREKDVPEQSKNQNKELLALRKNYEYFKKYNEGLEQEIVLLENILKNEKAKLYSELGTAYIKAKLFSLALQAYEGSLTFNPNNADVHYKLGLLYKHYLDNSKKAAFHLRKYLELNSKAENRKEVEYLIGMLGEKKF